MYGNILKGGIPHFFFCGKFVKIMMVSDKTIHKAFGIHKTLFIKPIRENFHLHYLP